MADDLTDRLGQLFKSRPWYKLPRLLGSVKLVEMRDELRAKNLHDTEEPPLERKAVPADLDPALREGRSADGSFNDLQVPKMGSAGCRFGRNLPLQHIFPDVPNLLIPNPRHVSRELMTRDRFQPATTLNLLAASWIQFMVHDWFVHERSASERIDIPTAPAMTGARRAFRFRDRGRQAPAGSTRPPAYTNLNSHWWDASQIYGCDDDMAAKLRTHIAGKLRIEPQACCRSTPRPASTSPASATTGGSAWPCSTRSSRWSTTTSAICSLTSTTTGPTTSSFAKPN